MSARGVAARYAKALVGYLAEHKAKDDLVAFTDFCDMVARHDNLVALFANVTVDNHDKAKAVEVIATKAGLAQALVRFLTILAENGRLGILAEVKQAVLDQWDAMENIRNVALITATPPGEEAVAQFKQKMEQILGGQIRIENRHDPEILGGAIARVGSVVYDGSVRGHLAKLRNQLVKEN